MAREGNTRVVLVGALLFVVGFAVGGVGPRSQVRDLQAQRYELEKHLAGKRGGEAITEIIARSATEGGRRDGRGREARDAKRAAVADEAARGATPVAPREGVAGNEPFDGPPVDDPPPAEPDDFAGDTIEEVMALRAAAARSALYEEVQPTDAQWDAIELAIDDMNDVLLSVASDLIEDVRVNGEPPRHRLMSLASEVFDVMARTESQMLDTLTPVQRANARDEATDPLAFIDPSVVRLLESSGLRDR